MSEIRAALAGWRNTQEDTVALSLISDFTDEQLAIIDKATGGLPSDVRVQIKDFREAKGPGFTIGRLLPSAAAKMTAEERRIFSFARVLQARAMERVAMIGLIADKTIDENALPPKLQGIYRMVIKKLEAGASAAHEFSALPTDMLTAEFGFTQAQATAIDVQAKARLNNAYAWRRWYDSDPMAVSPIGMAYWYGVAEAVQSMATQSGSSAFRVNYGNDPTDANIVAFPTAEQVRAAFESGGPEAVLPHTADHGLTIADVGGENVDLGPELGGERKKKRKGLAKLLDLAPLIMGAAAPVVAAIPGVGTIAGAALAAGAVALGAVQARKRAKAADKEAKRAQEEAIAMADAQAAAAPNPVMAQAFKEQADAIRVAPTSAFRPAEEAAPDLDLHALTDQTASLARGAVSKIEERKAADRQEDMAKSLEMQALASPTPAVAASMREQAASVRSAPVAAFMPQDDGSTKPFATTTEHVASLFARDLPTVEEHPLGTVDHPLTATIDEYSKIGAGGPEFGGPPMRGPITIYDLLEYGGPDIDFYVNEQGDGEQPETGGKKKKKGLKGLLKKVAPVAALSAFGPLGTIAGLAIASKKGKKKKKGGKSKKSPREREEAAARGEDPDAPDNAASTAIGVDIDLDEYPDGNGLTADMPGYDGSMYQDSMGNWPGDDEYDPTGIQKAVLTDDPAAAINAQLGAQVAMGRSVDLNQPNPLGMLTPMEQASLSTQLTNLQNPGGGFNYPTLPGPNYNPAALPGAPGYQPPSQQFTPTGYPTSPRQDPFGPQSPYPQYPQPAGAQPYPMSPYNQPSGPRMYDF
jgi:hypothetical protein